VGERAKLSRLTEKQDQTAIEIMRLVLADEAAPEPRREIVISLSKTTIF
jgi:hypothetical protein